MNATAQLKYRRMRAMNNKSAQRIIDKDYTMIRHVVLMKWHDELTATEMAEVRSSLDRLRAEVPVVRALAHGPSLGLADSGTDYALTIDLDDEAAWQAYIDHPSHDVARQALRRFAAEVRSTQFHVANHEDVTEPAQEASS
jgi:hypothetical protein